MIKKYLCFFLFFSVFKLTMAESYHWDPAVDSVLNLIMNQEYGEAFKYCDLKMSLDPLDVDARYLKLVTLQSQLADYESYALDGPGCISMAESLLILIDNRMSLAQSGIETQKLDLYKGNIFGVLGIVKAKRGSILLSIKDARMSYDYFKKVKKETSAFPDALYGLGLFDYYLGDNLKWIPGLGKRARSGLDQLYAASNSDSPFRFGAKNSLLWILMERGEFYAADSIASEVLQKYPQNTLFLQVKSRAVYGAKQYQQAIELAEELIRLSLKRKTINWCDVLSGYQLICLCWLKLGNQKNAQEIAAKALSFTIPADTLKIEWVQKHRSYLMSVK